MSNDVRCVCADYVVEGEELTLKRGGCIEFSDEGVIVGVGVSRTASRPCAALPGYLMPPLCNAHVHALDYVAVEAGEGLSLEELVAHPHGLKYTILEKTPLKRIEDSLKIVAARMTDDGVLYAGVYAEEGFTGASPVLNVLGSFGLHVRVLAQPTRKSLHEYLQLLYSYSGVGLDTIFDISTGELKELARQASSIDGHVHVHVAETPELAAQKDYEIALDAKPTAVVHLTYVDGETVLEFAYEGIGVVFCPRSNMLTSGAIPPLEALIEIASNHKPVGLGTDNAAWITSSIAEELSYAYLAGRSRVRDVEEYAWSLLYASTLGCTKLLGFKTAPVTEGSHFVLAVVTPDARYSHKPTITLVKRMAFSSRLLIGLTPAQTLIRQ